MGSEETGLFPMTLTDLDGVMEVERLSFLTPWSRRDFLVELMQPFAVYIVARRGEQVVGYGGMHVIADQAHVTNIAVHPDHRGQGLGERIMRRLIELAAERGAERMTLEVRVSNTPARNLYEKLGFVTAPGAVRKGYYTDTGEDAIVMWKEPLAEQAAAEGQQ
ncbi:MAG TPA: ribosomal protein S18-alanine N-acetyltransferase [Symbiobacteriaceae bacterium]